jgi:hypothetical protein
MVFEPRAGQVCGAGNRNPKALLTDAARRRGNRRRRESHRAGCDRPERLLRESLRDESLSREDARMRCLHLESLRDQSLSREHARMGRLHLESLRD